MKIVKPASSATRGRGSPKTITSEFVDPPVAIHVSAKDILIVLICAAAALFIADISVIFAKYALGLPKMLGMNRLFHLGLEWNAPAIFSFFLFVLCSFCLSIIGIMSSPNDRRGLWIFLGIIFFILGMDELFSIHEKFDRPIRGAFDTSGVLLYAWIIPYSLFILALALLCLRWWLSLPRNIRLLMLTAAALYISGAVGVEMLEGLYESGSAVQPFVWDLNYELMVTVEEMLEICGLVIFSYALLSYISLKHKGVAILVAVRSA